MEILLVLAIALLVLGPKRLPEAGRSLGKGIREFKDSLASVGNDEPELPPAREPTEARKSELP